MEDKYNDNNNYNNNDNDDYNNNHNDNNHNDNNHNDNDNTDNDNNYNDNNDNNDNDNYNNTDINMIIYKLKEKYKNNQYMIQRLENHIINLPNILEQENKKYDERINRFNELTFEQDNFLKVFLSKNQYFYMPYNNIYYEYDRQTFKIIKDDDIHYKLLSTITDEGKLIQWKHKTKQNIIKKIKDRSLLKATPETYTIQNVLTFLQTIFPTKSEAKYFLTVIGDCILKKNIDLLYFVSSNFKKILMLIDAVVYITTGNTIINNFITKYHDVHKLDNYRLIKESNLLSNDIVKGIINNIGIDLLCVSTHYSERYVTSEHYLITKCENEIKNYILYFSQNSLEHIINHFIIQCIENVSVNTHITWKNMHYIWKSYLTSLNLPNMVYINQLQILLSSKLKYINDNGNIVFINVTSKYLPSVSCFLSFWDKYITITNDINNDDEYEIDELMTLYKTSEDKNIQISDVSLIKMICHYFSPQVEVIDNKYITNIKCKLWSKQDDINDFLIFYKSNYSNNINTNKHKNKEQIISFDDLYNSYKNTFKAKIIVEQKNYPIVSKQFFEKYICDKLTNYIKFEKFVSSEWFDE